MIQLRNVTLRRGAKVLLEGVSATINPGEKVGLVGRNGAGKSTLLRVIADEIHADAGERTITPGTRIAYVRQEPEIVGETLLDYAIGGGAASHEAEAAL